MIIFLNEDRAYLYWVTHHRQGYVIDGRRKPKLGHLSIHRATCSEIKSAPSARVQWTTGAKIKVCSLDRYELETWARDETQSQAQYCGVCRSGEDLPSDDGGTVHLTKLAGEILDYVLDAALIHMEQEHPPYRLTVGDIAACFGKTPGQISSALHHLIDDGFFTVCGKMAKASPIPPTRIVLPTAAALRTFDAFREESDAVVQAELQKLGPN